MVADKEFYYSTYHGKLSEADVEGLSLIHI